MPVLIRFVCIQLYSTSNKKYCIKILLCVAHCAVCACAPTTVWSHCTPSVYELLMGTRTFT